MKQLVLTLSVGLVAIAVGSATAPVANPQESETSPRLVEYQEVPGETEFSGVVCARPLQAEDAEELGLTPIELALRVDAGRAALRAYQLEKYVRETDEYLLRVPEDETENDVANALLATGGFEYVEPDWRVYPTNCPNDSQYGSQWHHQPNIMQSCDGWGMETGDPSVIVAICDTGIYAPHQDLQLHRNEGFHAPSDRWENQGGPIDDIHGHGTQCTGCAAGNGNNNIGISGVGWNLGHRMMRVSDVSSGSSTISILTLAARRAAEVGDRVASVSYSGVQSSSVNTTGAYVRSFDALLVWSAGNASATMSGNRDDNVIIVGATDSGDNLAGFSNRGSLVDLVAPGVAVYTTNRGSASAYTAVSGTSFSCPLTAGLCALIWSRNPSLTAQDVENVLRASCEDLGASGIDNNFGHGRINVARAMQMTPDPALLISYPNGRPTDIAPGGGSTVDVIAAPGQQTADVNAARFWVDTGSGFSTQPLQFIGSHTFRATFPSAPCPSEVRYYFEFPFVGNGSINSPADGANTPFMATAASRVLISTDDLEQNAPWLIGSATDTATSGIWIRVNPVGTPAQPEDDHTPNGTMCFVTGQGTTTGNLMENEVNGGATTLITPNIDLSTYNDPAIGYWRWYSNDQQGAVDDTFVIDMTTDVGQTWTVVETLGPTFSTEGWDYYEFRVRDLAPPTATVRLRFVASDFGSPSAVEAAIDDLQVIELCEGACGTSRYCNPLPNSTGLPALVNSSGSTSFSANDLVLTVSQGPPNSVGIFGYSPDRNSQPLGNGILCLGGQTLGTVIRLPVVFLDGTGSGAHPFDNTSPPIALGQVAAGETWNFQFWYRDVFPGSSGFNLSDALAITFCP